MVNECQNIKNIFLKLVRYMHHISSRSKLNEGRGLDGLEQIIFYPSYQCLKYIFHVYLVNKSQEERLRSPPPLGSNTHAPRLSWYIVIQTKTCKFIEYNLSYHEYSADRFALSYLKAESHEMVKKDVVESQSTHNVTCKLILISMWRLSELFNMINICGLFICNSEYMYLNISLYV